MFCPVCKDLVRPVFQGGTLKYVSKGCGIEYPVDGEGTLVIDDDDMFLYTTRSGKVIASYPNNQKILMKCPGCKQEKIVGYDVINFKKMYGCDCNHTWWQTTRGS